MSIKRIIKEYLMSKEYSPMNRIDLAEHFGMKKGDYKDFFKVLKSMEKEDLIYKTDNGLYKAFNDSQILRGTFDANRAGFGFVVVEGREDDIFVSSENTMYAMDGDEVSVRLFENRYGSREEGKIIKINSRKNKKIVGLYLDSDKYGFVIPDNKKIIYDIFIRNEKKRNAANNDKVIVEIIKWPEKNKNPEGRIVEIFGKKDDPHIDISSIIKSYDLREFFPNKVIEEAESISDFISPEEIKKRKDYRDILTFTIDGVDAKDLDDAISLDITKDGYKLYVHIADVAHYVKEKSLMDKEAYLRGNSYYLLDRVLPMLPKKLSNNLCSLNPDEDRLSLTVEMNFDKSGNISGHEINEGIIRSDKRLNYEDVSDFLENKKSAEDLNFDKIKDILENMRDLRNLLYSRRKVRGAIDFNFQETEIILNDDGSVRDVRAYDRRIANSIIEEFMLVCNETVAEEYFFRGLPFVYRVHDKPKNDKIKSLNEFLKTFGYSLKGSEIHPKEIQKITDAIKGKSEEALLSNLLLRSMQKAEYSFEERGHFGLAARYYSHFTSPIRRYSDLIIHRIIKDVINGKFTELKSRIYENSLEDITKHISKTELIQEKAERDIIDMKCAEYMSEHIGDEYNGIISSLNSFGIFIVLENTIEGLCRFSSMEDDFYYFDEVKYEVSGEHKKKRYKIGDKVRITVIDADKERRTVDFKIIEEDTDEEKF